MKKICVFTGKRGGFGAMYPLLQMIHNEPSMTLVLVAGDMHLNPLFGETLHEVQNLIEVNYVVDMGAYGGAFVDRGKALARCIDGLLDVLDEEKPDVLLLLGDRGETVAAAFAAVEMGVPVAHIQAGDISGGLDDIHRHAITKLSHLHFAQNESQRQRVIGLGEYPDRVWNTGAPYIDTLLDVPRESKAATLKALDVEDKRYIILLFHPDTYCPEKAGAQMQEIIEAIKQDGRTCICIYPCSDPGYEQIIAALEQLRGNPQFVIKKNVEFKVFVNLLFHADLLIGNSSAGIIEAPYFKLPFVLVGNRQNGRDHCLNVIQVEADTEQILRAMNEAEDSWFREKLEQIGYPFGKGQACKKIFEVLQKTVFDMNLFRKRITF